MWSSFLGQEVSCSLPVEMISQIAQNRFQSLQNEQCQYIKKIVMRALKLFPKEQLEKANIEHFYVLESLFPNHDAFTFLEKKDKDNLRQRKNKVFIGVNIDTLFGNGFEFTLAHEVFHAVHVILSPEVPQWIREALALYFESMVYSPEYYDSIYLHRSIGFIKHTNPIKTFDNQALNNGDLSAYGASYAFILYLMKVKFNLAGFTNQPVSKIRSFNSFFWSLLDFNDKAPFEFWSFFNKSEKQKNKKDFNEMMLNFYKTLIFNRPYYSEGDDKRYENFFDSLIPVWDFSLLDLLRMKKQELNKLFTVGKENKAIIGLYELDFEKKIKKIINDKKKFESLSFIYIKNKNFPYYAIISENKLSQFISNDEHPDLVLVIP